MEEGQEEKKHTTPYNVIYTTKKAMDHNYLHYGNFIFNFWFYCDKNLHDSEAFYLKGLSFNPSNIQIFIALIDLYIQEIKQNSSEEYSHYWINVRQYYSGIQSYEGQ